MNNIQWKNLIDCSNISRGNRITKSELIQNAKYSVISGGSKEMGRYDNFNRSQNTITIAQYGTAGFIAWQENKFWANDVCYSINAKSNLNQKYLYYFLKNKQNNIYALLTNAIPQHLPFEKLKNLLIPIPSIEIQAKIVDILDNFAELTAELTAELLARKEQYHYYRNKLLSFDALEDNDIDSKTKNHSNYYYEPVQWKSLSQVLKIRGGYTPSKNNSNFWIDGNIPWFRMEDIRKNGNILSNSIQKTTKSGIRGNTFKENSIILATTATIGEHALIKVPFIANQRFTIFTILDDMESIINPKFLFYYFFKIDEWCIKNTNNSAFPSVNMKSLKKLLIPIPSIEVQTKIVKILDQFDTLCNDILKGLPAEIKARQEQYEYYRNKLLTF